MRSIWGVLVLALMSAVSVGATRSPDPARLDDWVDRIREGRVVPFSFALDGKPAAIKHEAIRVAQDGAWTVVTIDYALPGASLKVRLICRVSPDRSIVRQTIALDNGEARSPRIGSVHILDLPLPVTGQQRIHGLRGAELRHDFEPWSEPLSEAGAKVARHSSMAGRSTTTEYTTWLLAQADRGVWFALEWSGVWNMTAARSADATRLVLGLPTFDFILEPNEKIELPTVVYGPYRGDTEAGFNHIRQVVADHYVPPIGGARPTPQVYFQGLAGHPRWHDEKTLYAEVDAAAQVGCEAWILDGGWNCPPTQVWINTLGKWEDHRRFPRGLKRFGQYVKDAGMRFGIWMEPRCVADGKLYLENQDKFLYLDQPGFLNYPLINLAMPEGRKLMFDVLDGFVREHGADWIWFDFNTDPHKNFFGPIDTRAFPDRKGLLELAWYQGLYEVLDQFRAAHPDVWLETCSSGGRLMDLGMLRRSHSVWVTDWSHDDEVARVARSGLNQFLSATYIQSSLFMPSVFQPGRFQLEHATPKPHTPVDVDRRLPLYFAGHLGFGQGLAFWDDASIRRAAELTRIYKRHRRYLAGDYYHLYPTVRRTDVWDGWQYHDPQSDSGVIILTRLSADAPPKSQLDLRGVETVNAYTFRTLCGQADLTPTERTLNVAMPVGSLVVHYERK